MKPSWRNFLQASILVVVFCFMSLITGCQTDNDRSLTYKMWNDKNRRSLEEPSPQPRLALFEAPSGNDVIVEYDTMADKYDQGERRAYLLNENQKRVAAHRKPVFINPSLADGQRLIPVVNSEITDAPNLKTYAVLSGDGRQFILYRQGKPPEHFDLPVYQNASGIIKQVALDPLRVAVTPITATGDLMTGALASTPTTSSALEASGAVIYWASFMWLLAGAPGVNY